MMQPLTLMQLARLLEATARGQGDPAFTQVVTDTRKACDHSLFVALQGQNFDGHQFLAQARQAGACLALVEHWVDDPLPQVKVPSCLKALGQLAAWNRKLFTGPVIGITGNSGKTTVKEMLAACLRLDRGNLLATPGNYNNAIGLPLTLLDLKPEHQAAVIELGANHLGEIDYLADIARPDLGLITNVTGAHLGEFGSLQAIASAKGELLSWLPKDQPAILNAEDAFFNFWQDLAPGPVCSFGLHSGDLHAEDLSQDGQGHFSFIASTPWGQQPIKLALPGQHNVANALACMALAGHLGVSLATQAEALAALQPVKGRLQRINAYGDALLLDDSYNASPGAVKSAIDLLASLPGVRILALGALAELGSASQTIHKELGEYARDKKLDGFYVLAGEAEAAAQAFGHRAEIFADHAALAAALKPRLDRNTCLLVKGSRSARMDLLVDLLRREAAEA